VTHHLAQANIARACVRRSRIDPWGSGHLARIYALGAPSPGFVWTWRMATSTPVTPT